MRKLIFFLLITGCAISMQAQQDSSLQEYKGTYKFPDGSIVPSVEITLDNGSVIINSQMGSATLEKISKDTFSLTVYNATVYFIRDADKKVNAIKIETPDLILEGKKEGAGFAYIRTRKIYYTN